MSLDKDQAMSELSLRYDVGLPPATAGAFGEALDNAHASRRLASPKATKEPEPGEAMSERKVLNEL